MVCEVGEGCMSRGYVGIGIENLIDRQNIGTLWRSAYAFGANFIFTIGKRYEYQTSDVHHVSRHMPLFSYSTFEDLRKALDEKVKVIGIEFMPTAKSLDSYSHPERCVYLLGSEGRGISNTMLEKVDDILYIPTVVCLNVASAGTVVLFHRFMQRRKLNAN